MTLEMTCPPQAKARRIVLARAAGFCVGVRRAVEMVMRTRQTRWGKMTMLGPLIHNEQTIDRLKAVGVDTAPRLTDIHEGTVVISAHGVAPAVREQAAAQGLEVVDTTCPFVTKVHRAARQLVAEGYQLLLVGDRGHTEVEGVLGAVDGQATVVASVEELGQVELGRKVGVVAQTTQKADTFAAIVSAAAKRVQEVRAINTVCGATDTLQDAARQLAREVDVVIVIGGRKSANTRRLRETCAGEGVPAYQVETAEDIREEWLEGAETIGVTAGASTPDWLIYDIIASLNGGVVPPDLRVRHPDE